MRCAVVVGLLMFQFGVAFRGGKAVLVFHNGFFNTFFFFSLKILALYFHLFYFILPMEAKRAQLVFLCQPEKKNRAPLV